MYPSDFRLFSVSPISRVGRCSLQKLDLLKGENKMWQGRSNTVKKLFVNSEFHAEISLCFKTKAKNFTTHDVPMQNGRRGSD